MFGMAGEGIVASRTLNTQKYTGLKVNITIPWTFGSPNVGENKDHYFDFYLGTQNLKYNKTDIEAGIFYYTQKGWTLFLNMVAWNAPGPSVWKEKAVAVTAGNTYSMELRNNGNGTATFYWNGSAIWTEAIPAGFEDRLPTDGGWFKMVHGKVDDSHMFYKGAKFTSPQLRSSTGTYSNWSASTQGYSPSNSGDTAAFTISSQFPVATNLN